MEFKNLLLTIENKVAHLTINRPEKANSMNELSWKELKEALHFCNDTPEVRAIVFNGAGPNYFVAALI